MKNYTPAIAALIAFLVTYLLGYIVIPYLRKLKFGQTILEIGPKWHKDKQGTPTMGGVMLVAGVLFSLAITYGFSLILGNEFATELNIRFNSVVLVAGLIMALCMCAIGFFDDYIKVVKKRNLGLTAKQKTFLQLLVAAAYLITLALSGMHTTYIPFVGEISIISGVGLIFWPIALLFIYGFTNAVNLTDGLDGLASSVTLVVACAFMLASGFLGISTINIMSASLAGACVGFIIWNSKPARVFMGDTGSMFLGGMVVAIAYALDCPVILILTGFIYVIEALSDVIQIGYFKITHGKRIFKMAPIHHHFEMCGWSEKKIDAVFCTVNLIAGIIGVVVMYYGGFTV